MNKKINKKITNKSGFLQRQVRHKVIDKDKRVITGTCPRCESKVSVSTEHADKICPHCELLLYWG